MGWGQAWGLSQGRSQGSEGSRLKGREWDSLVMVVKLQDRGGVRGQGGGGLALPQGPQEAGV